jgi:hypothetical protein
MSADRALERLYAVSPKDFTRTRNTLAAELRKSRDLDAARIVAGLRRPSATLWATNQLARHAGAALERFLDAVERLRRTQLSDPRGAMEAMRAERAQLEGLVTRAQQALSEAGYSPSADARRRIADTLLGAAADRRHAEALAHGRLTEELHAPGFDALTGTPHLRVVQGRAAANDAASAAGARRLAVGDERHPARETKTQQRDTKTSEREAARMRAREEQERARGAKAAERAQRAEERRRAAEERRREAAERAAQVAALQREAAAAREQLADVERRLKKARRGSRRRAR